MKNDYSLGWPMDEALQAFGKYIKIIFYNLALASWNLIFAFYLYYIKFKVQITKINNLQLIVAKLCPKSLEILICLFLYY